MAPSYCIELTRGQQADLLAIARASIEQGLDSKQPLKIARSQLIGPFRIKLGSFVTLLNGGMLRGCVGSIAAIQPLAQAVATAAFNAAFRENRFPPLSDIEIGNTRIEVSVLSPPQALDANSNRELLAQLRPREDGLVLVDTTRSATFLPKVWKHLPESAQFVEHLKAKAGLPCDHWSDSIRFYRYRTVSFAEQPAETTSPA